MNPATQAQRTALKGLRILSLALNLPGPAALLRCRQMGARCVKLEPPAGDPMRQYQAHAYATLHAGVRVTVADLKSEAGRKALQRELLKADVLLTSFRPSALRKLGLDWKTLHQQHPHLSQVAIVGAPGELAEEAGHDLTYQAQAGLLTGLALPPTLYADMGGAVMASEAVLQAVLMQRSKGQGVFLQVALSSAADWLALPRHWGLTTPEGAVGGAHAGYRIYPCQDGRVALAALEPHFAAALCLATGVAGSSIQTMFAPDTHQSISAWLLGKTCRELETWAIREDIPLTTLPSSLRTVVA